MPLVNLPIRKPNYNVEPQAKVLLVDDARDCHYEATGEGNYCIRRRPGYSHFSTVGAGEVGQGIFWSDRLATAYAVVGGKLYKIDSAGTATQINGASLESFQHVIFAEGQELDLSPMIAIAHGGYLRYTDGTALYSYADAMTPQATYVAFNNGRFYADDGGQDFLVTDTDPSTGLLDPTYWSATANPLRTAQRADLLKALYAGWNEIALLGTQTIEYWQEDGVTPVAPLMGATTEAGIIAPYSLVMANNALMALCSVSGKRAVAQIQGRSPKIISTDIDRELQEMTTVDDAVGALVFAGGLNAYILNFPTERVSLAYDLKEGIWSKWGAWNSVEARYDCFPIVGSCYAKAWNKHLFLGSYGNVYELSRNAYQDSGNEIRTLIRTGQVNHGTSRRKTSRELTIKVKAYSSTPASLMMRFRDDGRPEWTPYIEIPLGSASEQTHYARLARMGEYRSRQYEFLLTDNADLALMGIQEDVEVKSS